MLGEVDSDHGQTKRPVCVFEERDGVEISTSHHIEYTTRSRGGENSPETTVRVPYVRALNNCGGG